MDRRVLDWVVGLDSEINELVEGSDLYGKPDMYVSCDATSSHVNLN